MTHDDAVFASETWRQAVAQYSAATQLTVRVYSAGGALLDEHVHPTPLYELLTRRGPDCLAFDGAARRDARDDARRIRLRECDGLAALAVRIAPDVVAVAGIAVIERVDEAGAELLARTHELPFQAVWDAVRQTTPVSRAQLTMCGELLATLVETLLRERARARGLEAASTELTERLRARDEFLAVLSHELRVPLAPILSWLHMLRATPDAHLVRRAADVIERNVRREIDLVNDLLDLNRVERGELIVERAPHDLREIVRAAVETMSALATERRLAIESRAPASPVLIEGDARRLAQVFGNLLSNAIKFTPAGGRITVDVTVSEDRAVTSIRDTGIGIPPAVLPSVFDMFRQAEPGARRQPEGLGIGLAVARRLTELHHGTIRASSAGPGTGTEMTVSLPLLSRKSRAVAPVHLADRHLASAPPASTCSSATSPAPGGMPRGPA
jgi:signal transduction histidine kinase